MKNKYAQTMNIHELRPSIEVVDKTANASLDELAVLRQLVLAPLLRQQALLEKQHLRMRY